MTESPEHDDNPLPLGDADWPVPTPPEGFAERTAAKFFDDERVQSVPASEPEPPRRRGWRLPFAGGVAAAAAVAVLWQAWPAASHAASDSLTTRTMQTIAMSDRALAVASSGTTLEWIVDESGDASVAQQTGSVFYRVEEGGAFDVMTPAGTVSVTGTCFEVETRPMKTSGIKAAAMGAALASAVVVTVYEGSVVFANERGEVALQPGQRAKADAHSKPHRIADDAPDSEAADPDGSSATPRPDADDAVAHARRQERALAKAHEEQLAQEAEIERLRKQVTELGGQPGEPTAAELQVRARKCAGQGRGGDCPFLEPDEDTLREMARCAAVKVDFPGFLDNVDRPEVSNYARSLGISDANEVAGLQAAADKHYAEFNGRLREIFVELGGDAEMAEDASAATMKSYIADQLDRELMGDVQRKVAEERAGMREPPADLSALPIEEQAFRLHAELGNAFEQHLADQLGAERARELRRVKDGWPGSTSVNSGNCVDPE